MNKRGQEVPGPSKKVPGLLDFLGPGTTGPRNLRGLVGPVLSCPVPGPSRDFPGRNSPAGKPSPHVNSMFLEKSDIETPVQKSFSTIYHSSGTPPVLTEKRLSSPKLTRRPTQ